MRYLLMLYKWALEEEEFLNKFAVVMIIKGIFEFIAAQSLFMLEMEEFIDDWMTLLAVVCGIFLMIRAKKVDAQVMEGDEYD